MNSPHQSEPRVTASEQPAGGRPPLPALTAPPQDEPDHRWGFGAFLLVEAVFLISSVFIVLPFKAPDGRVSPVGLLVSLAVPTVLAAGVAVLATVVRGNGPKVDLRLCWRWADVGVGLSLGLGGFVVTMIASVLWTRWVGQKNANSAVGSLLDGVHLSPAIAVLMFLHLWLLAPLCEEVIYRGLLWGAIERQRWGRWTPFVLTTMIFAVAHLEPLRTPLLLVIAVPIGLGRLITGRLVSSVIAHQLNNLLPALGILLVALGLMPG
ncbi:CPBP family intramembrane glutamic endopeptidase [Gandjariella thermophila]|uniref:Membrane protein n=1 Tax=Gandjariella thermophila TaxID=1931992 RepID=A0A4D4J6C8_9PSEU|nr:type II CAAX endopeptidase family protein [Gandjariella thermophila]GDY30620.1 membrane protein [Gandjariella thermophila]